MALALGRLLQFQGLKQSIHLWHNMYKTYNAYNRKGNQKYSQVIWDWMVTITIRSRTKVSQPHKYSADR
jgi:hypothetical protein